MVHTGDPICTRIRSLLPAYVDHELNSQDTLAAEAHLAGCRQCRSYLEQIYALDAHLHRLRKTGQPAQLATGVMHALGIENHEGGRITSTATATRQASGSLKRPLLLLARFGMAALILTIVGILGLFVLARIRQLPQTPPPEVTLNAASFDQGDIAFYLNASSEQGIRDLSLSYWYDPREVVSQDFHYEFPQPEIEFNHHASNVNAYSVLAPARAVFYQWTIKEKSGRTTIMPVQYAVYSSDNSGTPWHAITTTHTIVYYTAEDTAMVQNLVGPVVEKVYSQVAAELQLSPRLSRQTMPSIYLFSDGSIGDGSQPRTTYSRGAGRIASFIRIDLTAMASPQHFQANLAAALSALMIEDAMPRMSAPTAGYIATERFLTAGISAYISQEYSPPAPIERLFLYDTLRNNRYVPAQTVLTEDADTSLLYAQAHNAFIQFMIDTYGKERMIRLLGLFLERPNDIVWSDVYGQPIEALYHQWWDAQVGGLTVKQASRNSAGTPADLFAANLQTLWDFPGAEAITLNKYFSENSWAPLWSGDSKRLLYLAGPNTPARLFLHAIDGDNPGTISGNTPSAGRDQHLYTDFGSFALYDWSPDGRSVLYSHTPRMLETIDLTTRKISALTGGNAGFSVQNAFWLPDGGVLYSGRQAGEQQHIYRLSAEMIAQAAAAGATPTPSQRASGDTPRTIPAVLPVARPFLPANAIPGDQSLLAISRDGKRLAVLGQQNFEPALYLVDLNGGLSVRRILELGSSWCDSVSFSPDGNRLLYSKQDGTQSSGIYIFDLQTNLATQLGGSQEPDRYDFWPAWIDDQRIVFDSTRDGGFDLYAIDTGGSSPVRLSKGPEYYLHPVVSPDGTHLAFLTLDKYHLITKVLTIDPHLWDTLTPAGK